MCVAKATKTTWFASVKTTKTTWFASVKTTKTTWLASVAKTTKTTWFASVAKTTKTTWFACYSWNKNKLSYPIQGSLSLSYIIVHTWCAPWEHTGLHAWALKCRSITIFFTTLSACSHFHASSGNFGPVTTDRAIDRAIDRASYRL